jgi:pimeloyl-ACP methyl ester carboxylesterase
VKLHRVAISAVVLFTVSISGLVPAAEAQATTKGCVSSIGKRVPVIMVHGFVSSPANAWGAMKPYISKYADNTYVETFDYSKYNKSWVDNDNIGPKLAKRIACLATSSKQAGGPGKVIAIGHSMGGLAIRYAATKSSNASEVTKDLGLVITVATPNTGSGLANIGSSMKYSLCHPVTITPPPAPPSDNACAVWDAVDGLANSSSSLSKLPSLPSQIPLKAIAGDVTVTLSLFNARVHQDLESDVVVSKDSALEKHAHTDLGGGTYTLDCDTALKDATNTSKTPCWHSGLTSAPQVMKEVVKSIKQFYQGFLLTDFVGKWGAHSTGMTINADGTGMFSMRNYGDCPYAPANEVSNTFSMCNTRETIKVVATESSATVTVLTSHTTVSDDSNSIVWDHKNDFKGVVYELGKPDIRGKMSIKSKRINYDYNLCRPGGDADVAGDCGL